MTAAASATGMITAIPATVRSSVTGDGAVEAPVSVESGPVESASATVTGARDVAPLALALVPFALAIGSAISATGLRLSVGVGGGVMMLAGSAQLAVIGLLDNGAGVATAVSTAFLINLRFALYSAGLARWFEGEPLGRRLLLAIPLVDQNFVLSERAFTANRGLRWRRQYFVTVSGVLIAAYLGSEVVGYFVGSSVPDSWGLDLAGPLAFAGLLGTAVRGSAAGTTALVAGVTVLLAAPLPGGLALPVAAVAGVLAGSSSRVSR
jgi:predicted branched-subunit amino acid permease